LIELCRTPTNTLLACLHGLSGVGVETPTPFSAQESLADFVAL
jgi:hypothetical protein